MTVTEKHATLTVKIAERSKILTSETQNTRTKCCVEYLVMYLHIISFKELVLECACKAIKPVSEPITKYTIKIPSFFLTRQQNRINSETSKQIHIPKITSHKGNTPNSIFPTLIVRTNIISCLQIRFT